MIYRKCVNYDAIVHDLYGARSGSPQLHNVEALGPGLVSPPICQPLTKYLLLAICNGPYFEHCKLLSIVFVHGHEGLVSVL